MRQPLAWREGQTWTGFLRAEWRTQRPLHLPGKQARVRVPHQCSRSWTCVSFCLVFHENCVPDRLNVAARSIVSDVESAKPDNIVYGAGTRV